MGCYLQQFMQDNGVGCTCEIRPPDAGVPVEGAGSMSRDKGVSEKFLISVAVVLTLSGAVGRLCTTFFCLSFFFLNFIFPIDFGTLSMQRYTY